MNAQDDGNGKRGRDEIVAGEYVLGVLSTDARRAAEERMAREPDFAARIRRWENDLASFNADYEAVEPPRAAFGRIEARLFAAGASGPATAGAAGGVWASLIFWRALAFCCLALAIGLGAVVALSGPAPSGPPLVADLSAKNGAIGLVAHYDESNGKLQITPIAARAQEPRSLQLWMINGKNPPVSLGVLPQNGRGEVVVPAGVRARIGDGTVLAVSLEPQGGSPTGQPTGPVLAAGPVRSL